MRILIMALLAIATAACSGGNQQTTANEIEVAKTSVEETKAEVTSASVEEVAESARIAAVLIKADWCSSCKIIEPKLAAAKAQGDIAGLEHLAIDYTDRNKETFYANAAKLGVAEPINSYLEGDVKTGIILLIDTDTNEVVADLRKELSEEELRMKMLEAAARA